METPDFDLISFGAGFFAAVILELFRLAFIHRFRKKPVAYTLQLSEGGLNSDSSPYDLIPNQGQTA